MHLQTIMHFMDFLNHNNLRGASEGVSVLDPVAESVALGDLAWVSLRVEQGAESTSNLRCFSLRLYRVSWKCRLKQRKYKKGFEFNYGYEDDVTSCWPLCGRRACTSLSKALQILISKRAKPQIPSQRI